MPYIPREIKMELKELKAVPPSNAGELTYLITENILDYLAQRRKETGIINKFEEYNSVLGSLEATKMEFYRRMVAPYEDKKIRENGDVYP
jgi:hypothetical protein